MTITGYQGLFLFYVGAVLLVNGVWLLGHIEDKEVALMDFFAGGVGLFVCISLPTRAAPEDLLPFEVAAYISCLRLLIFGLPSTVTFTQMVED